MVVIDVEQVKHIAKLARLGIKDADLGKFAQQLSAIFGYVEKLNEVNVDGVEPTSQVTGLQNVMRKDEVVKVCTREELLGTTELAVELDQIEVLPAIKN